MRFRTAVRLGLLVELLAQRLGDRSGIGADLPEDARHHAALLFGERHKQVLGFGLRVAQFRCQLRRGNDGLLRLLGEFVQVHDCKLLTVDRTLNS